MRLVDRIRAKTQNVFYGWWLVGVGFCLNAFGIGTFFYGFSAFFNPMITEFGWSRAAMSGVYSLSRLEGGIEGPLVGYLVDRFGSKRLMHIGIALSGVGFIAISLVNSIFSLYALFLILSVGYNLAYTHASGAVIAKWFVKKRSRAFSILTTGNGVGGAIFVPIIAYLIIHFGWRTATVILGVAAFCLPLPLSFLVRSTPEEMGLKPDGDAAPARPAAPANEAKEASLVEEEPQNEDFSVRQALKTRAFWTYAASMILRSCILSSIVIHQIPHLTDIGIPYQAASTVLGTMVLMSIPSRFIFGWLGDRFEKRLLMLLLCLLQAAGIFIFIHARTTQLLYLFVLIYGMGYGGLIPLTIAFRADLFGRKNYATIAGMTTSLTMIGTVLAPVLAGYLYDTTHSYSVAFYAFIVMIILSGILFTLIPRTAAEKARAAA